MTVKRRRERIASISFQLEDQAIQRRAGVAADAQISY
jgi:hypothetical protein